MGELVDKPTVSTYLEEAQAYEVLKDAAGIVCSVLAYLRQKDLLYKIQLIMRKAQTLFDSGTMDESGVVRTIKREVSP